MKIRFSSDDYIWNQRQSFLKNIIPGTRFRLGAETHAEENKKLSDRNKKPKGLIKCN